MKQKLNLMMVALMLSFLWVPLRLSAQEDNVVLQPQFGKQTVTVKTGQEITFYDPEGTGSISSSNTSNAQSLTVFKPEEAGMSVQIVFEKVDLEGSSATYPAFIQIYNGEADADNSFQYATTTGEVNTNNLKLPEGDLLEKLTGEYSNKTYYSTTSDGALSVGYLYRYAETCDGWVAKVKCVKLEDMAVTGAGSDYTNVVSSPNSKNNVAFAGVYVDTKGVLNADKLTSVSFNLTKNESVIDPLSLKIYSGSLSSLKGVTPLDATVSENGGVYTFTLSAALAEGRNSFTIGGDINGDAAVGAQVQLEVTGVATEANASGVSPFTAGTPVAVTNPAIVLISSEYQTVTVGDDVLNFYDDGGVDGDATKGFNGKITFVPATAGKKVMVDFTKVDIFEGSIYTQSIKVYNGKEASAENLLRQVKKGETALIRSTSEDGALTVVFESTTDGFTGAGFEATVSQFTPQAMTVTGISAAQVTTGTVCAGDADQAILSFNINTKDTEPVLTTKSFSFTTNGTNAQVSKAVLYYTKASNEFATTVKIGETDVTADAFEITASNEVSLSEGDNYFWLAYTVSDMAVNGQKIDATIASVTLSDGNHSVEGNPEGDREVYNLVYSQANQGTVTKSVNESIAFRTKNQSRWSENYEGGNDDRINVFTPMHDGYICQIDFSKFALTYSSSSYLGVKASFKIYSGQGTSGELLWELNSADDKAVGPGRVLRSTSADGALTIVFNPNDSYSTDKGFEATVSEYKSEPMTVGSVVAQQSSTEIVPIGASGQEIISFNVATTGDLNAKTLNAVTLDLKGSEKSISKVLIYNAGAKNDAPSADAEAIASADIDGQLSEVTLTLAEPLALSEGDNYFRVMYDIKADAQAESVVDAAVKSIKIGEETINVTEGDPEGSRTLKNIYIIKSGENGEVQVTAGTNIMFYDDGGAEGEASDNFEGVVTFAPMNAGEAIKLTFNKWNVNATNTLYLYNGGEVKDNEDAKYSMYDKPTYFTSKSDDGKITVKFVTKYGSEGFEIEVSSYTKKAMGVEAVNAVSVAPENIMKGETDVCMMRVDVKVDGDYDKVNISKFALGDIDASVVSNVGVFTTDTTTVFAPTQLYGKTTSGNTAVEGSYEISTPGTYVFWVTYDIDKNAAENGVANASLVSLVANGTDFAIETPVTASSTVKKGISGTFTIGADADYGTIQAAVDALKGGIDGPVVLNIKRGIYNEVVTVPEIPGASANNTITLQSETGNYNDVRIYDNSYREPSYSDDKMAAEFGVFTFDGVDHFTLKGVEVTTNDNTYPSVVHIKNVSRYVTVDGCYLHTTSEDVSYPKDIAIVGGYAKNESNQNNDYFTVKNCLIEGGNIGVRMGGTTYVRLAKERGGRILNNTVRGQESKGLYVMDELDLRIIGNTIVNNTSNKNDYNAIDGQVRDVTTDSVVVAGNTIRLATQRSSQGIAFRQLVASAENPALIINNEVYMNVTASGSYPIYMNYPMTNVNFANNTVRLTGEIAAPAMYVNDTMENLNVVNNIFQNETGGLVYSFKKAEYLSPIKFSNNNEYTTGQVFANNATDITTFADWNTLSGETGNYNDNVSFLSDDVLEPAAEGNLRNALPLAYVKTDISGAQRDAANPTIGAYEYDGNAAAPVMAEGYPAVTDITDNSAVLNVKADVSSTAFVVVKGAEEAAPSKDDVLSSELTATARKNAVARVAFDGLVKDNEYIAYTVLKNLRGTAGEVVASEKFTATSEPIIEIPNASVVAEGCTVAAGEKATLTAYVTEGTAPFSLSWVDGKHNPVGTVELDALGDATIEYAPTECDDYYVTVTDANGKQGTDTCRVIVTGDAVTATFENRYLNEESYWAGPDTKGTPAVGAYGDNQMQGSFVSGSYSFSNDYSLDWGSWSGYAYSNKTSTKFESLNDQYNSSVGSGYDASENYAVAFSGGTITVLNNEEGDSIRGFYITNNAYALNSITVGDSYAHKFDKDDYLKVIFTGTKADGTTSNVEYYLADYRSENEADRYYLDTWQWVDLRGLGKVKSVSFSIDGSDKGQFGLNTPAYFCLDNFNGERVVTEQATQVAGTEVSLSGFFTFDNTEATISYAIADELPADVASYVTLSTDGKLSVSKELNKKISVVVSATQKGKIQFVSVPFDMASGLNGVEGTVSDNEAARYSVNGQRISAPQRGVNIVRTKDGKTYKVAVE